MEPPVLAPAPRMPSHTASPTITPAPQRRHYSEISVSSLSRKSLTSVGSVSRKSASSVASLSNRQSSASDLVTTTPATSIANSLTTGPSSLQLADSASTFIYPITTQTTIPLTLSLSSTTIVTSTTSLITALAVSTASVSPSPTSSSYDPGATSGMAQQQLASSAQGAVCAGSGIDSNGEGVLSTVLITALVGLLIWLVFAVLRPRLPQLYGCREWFVSQELRPRPLGSGLFAFLHPHVPLVPGMPSDMSNLGNSPAGDAKLFPSDEELSQRTLWIAFLIALGWTLLGVIVGLPIYMASTPCLANDTPATTYGSAYSTLSDLSLLRVLKMLDNNTITTTNGLNRRSIVDGVDMSGKARTRLIILTVLVILLGVLPVIWKLFREYNKVIAYRERWLHVRCAGIEMGWLSIEDAPGFIGWGEGRLKDFLSKNGLSTKLDRAKTPRGPQREASNPLGDRTGDSDETMLNEVDIQGIYTVPDTHRLSHLIDERKRVLDELEIAETQYINSFQLSHGSNSDQIIEPQRRPRSMSIGINRTRPTRRSGSRGEDAISGAPTSYLAPKSYYKLRNVGTVSESGSRPESAEIMPAPPMVPHDSSGSRFHEHEHDLPTLSTLIPQPSPTTATPEEVGGRPGPNKEDPALATDEFGQPIGHRPPGVSDAQRQTWPSTVGTDSAAPGPSNYGSQSVSAARGEPTDLFSPRIRPVTGQGRNLPAVYEAVRQARSQLKALNAEINDLQQEGFNNIAEGTRIKGWLVFGTGIHYITRVQMIEGRSKEDVRWDELQNSGGALRNVLWWILVIVVGLSLGAALVPVVGLAFAGAPNFAQYLPFLRSISASNSHNFGASIATTLVPAVVASLFIGIAVYFIHYSSRYSGKPSVATMRLSEFKAIFAVLVVICGVWLIALGGLLFATDAIANAQHRPASISEGTIYVAILLMLIIINLAIIAPGLLMLQPVRLWKTWRAQKRAITPRQRFRAIYPRSYNASFGLACCVLAVVFACAFSVIFPLIGPPVVLLLLLTLVAHRYLVGYVFGRAGVGQTGGLLHLWLLRRFATLVALQPLLLGLVLLAHRQWALGAILVSTAVGVIIAVEVYTRHRSHSISRRKLNTATKDALQRFKEASRPSTRRRRPTVTKETEAGGSVFSSNGTTTGTRRPRTSIASVLDMISLTLAVMPSTTRTRGPVPLDTEGIDDLVSTERAARTRPGAMPRVAFTDRAEETAGMLYPPQLLAPTPIVWLPNDSNGVGRQEAYDLQRYHGLEVTLDVPPDARRRRSSDSASRRATPI